MHIIIPEKKISFFSKENIVPLFKRFWWVITAIVIIIVSVNYLSARAGATSVNRKELTFGTVESGAFSIEARGSGVLKPRYSWWVSAESVATIKAIYVKSGEIVKVGQEIMLLSDPVLEEALETQKWEIPILEGNLEKAKSEKVQAILDQKIKIADLERNNYSLESQIATEQSLRDRNHNSMGEMQWKNLIRSLDFSKIQLKLEKEKATSIDKDHDSNINVLESQLNQAKFKLQQLRSRFENLRFVAKHEGLIQELSVEIGEQVIRGAALFKIASNETFVAEIKISQDEISQIQVGQSAVIRNRDGSFSGHVRRIGGAVENGTVKVEVDIDDELPAGVRADQNVDSTITIEKLENTLFVQRPAFVQASKEGWVYKVMPENGRVERIRVTFGKASVQKIQIIDGLLPKDQIVLSEPTAWIDKEQFFLR